MELEQRISQEQTRLLAKVVEPANEYKVGSNQTTYHGVVLLEERSFGKGTSIRYWM